MICNQKLIYENNKYAIHLCICLYLCYVILYHICLYYKLQLENSTIRNSSNDFTKFILDNNHIDKKEKILLIGKVYT